MAWFTFAQTGEILRLASSHPRSCLCKRATLYLSYLLINARTSKHATKNLCTRPAHGVKNNHHTTILRMVRQVTHNLWNPANVVSQPLCRSKRLLVGSFIWHSLTGILMGALDVSPFPTAFTHYFRSRSQEHQVTHSRASCSAVAPRPNCISQPELTYNRSACIPLCPQTFAEHELKSNFI